MKYEIGNRAKRKCDTHQKQSFTKVRYPLEYLFEHVLLITNIFLFSRRPRVAEPDQDVSMSHPDSTDS